jgi:DNA polymerase III subunit epsilon
VAKFNPEVEALAEQLRSQPNYRVLRRVDAGYSGGSPLTGTVRRAAIIDTETTGMDPEADQVVELGIIAFEYDPESGVVGPVVARYDGLEDPGRPIPPESIAIHHITDEMVRGKRFDELAVADLLAGVGLVIAHNAKFDRPFVEKRLPMFAGLPWACSMREVHWKAHGRASAALEFLAYKAGFFYEGHRAEVDCLAVLAVLAQPLGGGLGSGLKALLESARQPNLRIAAIGSAFETKDLLKDRGYRWDPERKVWSTEVPGAERKEELAWLKEAVYGGKEATIEVERLTAKERYSVRAGKMEKVRLNEAGFSSGPILPT